MARPATRRISDFCELQKLTPEWNDLCSRSPSATPFQRPEWLLPWLETFCPPELCVMQARSGDRLTGLAPMFIYSRGRERVMAPVGAGITDYLDWISDPTAERCIPAIVDGLEKGDWDVLELMDIPRTSPLIRGELPSHWISETCEVCPTLRLPPGATFNSVVPAHQRRNLKTAQNRIARGGRWHIEIANRDTLPEFLETLFRLHRARWRELGEPGVLADPKVQQFHTLSAPRLLAAGTLRFYGLRFQGKLIALLHTLSSANAIYCYLQGFDPAYAEFSPGMLVLEAVVRDALEEGKQAVDFLRGREKYKYMWGVQDEPTYRIRVCKTQSSLDLVRQAA